MKKQIVHFGHLQNGQPGLFTGNTLAMHLDKETENNEEAARARAERAGFEFEPSQIHIYIASYETDDSEHVTITAYTDQEAAKDACADAAKEFGLTIRPYKWVRNEHNGCLIADFKRVSFYVESRLLNGVSK